MTKCNMKEFVNRRDKDYHQKRLADINNLDLIASYVLALSWSENHNQSKKSQTLIQMDCVACVKVDGEYWLASNSQSLTQADLTKLKAELGEETPIWIVYNGDKNVMHAEMQLLSQLIQEDALSKVKYMGVSKPCCDLCRKKLDEYDIGYADWHNANVKNWQAPV